MPSRRDPLPEPERILSVAECAACGYELAWLGSDAPVCPECGRRYAGGALVLSGVVMSSRGGNPLRVLAWVVVTGLLVGVSQGWVLLLMVNAWLIPISLGLGIAGVVALVATSRRERQGRERVVLTRHGAARMPLAGAGEGDRRFVPYPAGAVVSLKPVSSRWARLRIGIGAGRGRVRGAVLDMGFTCDSSLMPMVRGALFHEGGLGLTEAG